MNDGSGTFTPSMDFGVGQSLVVAAADLDQDGDIDFLTGTNGFFTDLVIYLGQGCPDYDGDGLPNFWESAYPGAGLDAAVSNDINADKDLDGFSAWGEYLADTNPDDVTDYFRVTQDMNDPYSVVFNDPTGRLFTHQANSDLVDTNWVTIDSLSEVSGAGSSRVFRLETPFTSLYYRVLLEFTDP